MSPDASSTRRALVAPKRESAPFPQPHSVGTPRWPVAQEAQSPPAPRPHAPHRDSFAGDGGGDYLYPRLEGHGGPEASMCNPLRADSFGSFSLVTGDMGVSQLDLAFILVAWSAQHKR
ncbi:hypothetical protein CspeluHIS016_0801150 [Cutaneotrichosporon spelunceum]|uniref:Uncharacterized protein n=1 Tax=Cutaneotrichosporon spelunceum TaxID=1672016 RepID=A0AAD3TZP3_9TREE|nr:hypothetical protein CspeluHIS016_0801150 [Cutaneotrichosporon spelunceum]